MNVFLRRLSLLVYSIMPLLIIELGLQYFYRHDLSRRGWAWSWLLSPTLVAQTAPANTDQVFDSRWSGSPEQRPERGHVRFRTDRYGSIVPSTLTAALKAASQHPYVVFCGGSTTEAGVVSEGHRPADVFARLRGVPAVNLGRSGKSIDGCIASLQDLLLLQLPRPGLIVVANNVNTLMGFAQQQIAHQFSDQDGTSANHQVILQKVSLQSYLYQLFPGILHGVLKIKVAMGPYAEMEYGLKAGCCHAVSEVNRDASNFDWYSNSVQSRFGYYVQKRALLLAELMDQVKLSRDKLVIFIEPNSLALKVPVSGPDYRQRLRHFDGTFMNFTESAKITAIYDHIYSEAFRSQGFAVLQMPLSSLSTDYFYDAVHLTAQGARGVGTFYAEKLP